MATPAARLAKLQTSNPHDNEVCLMSFNGGQSYYDHSQTYTTIPDYRFLPDGRAEFRDGTIAAKPISFTMLPFTAADSVAQCREGRESC